MLLLRNEREKIPELYDRFVDDIDQHRRPISWLVKTETLQDSLETYEAKLQSQEAQPRRSL